MLLVLFIIASAFANPYQECVKLFNPNNYMERLPSLSLPFVNNIAIPSPNYAQIKPSRVLKTKVISMVTKYVYKNPVCVKYSGKKACKLTDTKDATRNNVEYLVTKEYFVNDHRPPKTLQDYEQRNKYDEIDLYVEGSEDPRPFGRKHTSTPTLSNEDINDLLIEDRLDQLETILPHYTRKRVYQTSTITVTKVRTNHRATATLIAKNCMPQGYDVCPRKVKKRKSKVAEFSEDPEEEHYYG